METSWHCESSVCTSSVSLRAQNAELQCWQFLLYLNGLWLQCWADETKGKMWLQEAINFHFSLLEGKQSSAKPFLKTWLLGTCEKHTFECSSIILLSRVNSCTLSDTSLRRINLNKLRVPMILRWEQKMAY